MLSIVAFRCSAMKSIWSLYKGLVSVHTHLNLKGREMKCRTKIFFAVFVSILSLYFIPAKREDLLARTPFTANIARMFASAAGQKHVILFNISWTFLGFH